MGYIAKPMSLKEIEKQTDEIFAAAIKEFFAKNPRKTTFKVKKGFTVRRWKQGYTIHIT